MIKAGVGANWVGGASTPAGPTRCSEIEEAKNQWFINWVALGE